MIKPIALSLGLCVVMAGCASINLETAKDAVLTQTSDESRAEITSAISDALGGRKVTIAPDTFTEQSSVSIVQRDMIGPDGNPVLGRRYDRPDHFYLKKSGASCILVHPSGREFTVLETVHCKPLG